jgi:hypothetical protein
MLSKVSASLEIGGSTCVLSVDQDETLSGRCTDVPLGVHSYVLKYLRSDLGVVIGTVEGSAALERGQSTEITLPPIQKTQDDDQDGYSNLIEVMFETDTQIASSKPGIPVFSLAAPYEVGLEPSDIALGDLNGDGVLDVVTTNRASDSLSIMFGNAEGILQTAATYATGPTGTGARNPSGLAIEDLNGDFSLDLLVVNAGEDSMFAGDLAVFLASGGGAFQDARVYTVGDQPVDLIAGDLNEDGFTDVVTANFGSGDVAVLLGNGDGSFLPAVRYTTGPVSSVVLGDLNGDSHLDVITSMFVSQSLGILLGNGDGTLQPVLPNPVGIMRSLALGDVNGDSRLDVVGSIVSSETVAVLVMKEDGAFQPVAFYAAGKAPETVVLKDLDLDGFLDVVTSNGDGVAAVLLGRGDGTFRAPGFFEMGQALTAIAVGDLNRDGGLDLIATDGMSSTATVLLTR